MRKWITGCLIGILLGLVGTSLAQIQVFPSTAVMQPPATGGTGQNSTAWNALVIVNPAGIWGQYTGTSCTNQFPRSLSVLGVATCASVNANTDMTGTVLNAAIVTSSLTSVGTIGTGTWQGTAVGVAYGGTGLATYAIGDLIYASAATTLARLADVAAGSYLRSGGVGVAPVWSTTTLPNSATTGDLLYASAGNTYANLADVAAGSYLRSGGAGVAPLWSTLILPNAATVNQVVYATSANTWGGSANLTYSGATFTFGGVNPFLVLADSGTSWSLVTLGTNASAHRLQLAQEDSAGGTITTGSTAYASIIGSRENDVLHITTNNTIRWSIGITGGLYSTGLANQGSGTANAGSYYVGNTAGCSGAPTASTNGINTTCASDERLKDTLGPFTRGLNALQFIEPIRFRWNDQSNDPDKTREHVGFGAQTIQRAIPEAVWLATQSDGSSYLTMSDRVLIGVLVNAVKELEARIKTLEARR